MRTLTLAACGLAFLVLVGCPPKADKPIPVNDKGNTPPAEPAEPAGPAPESTEPGGVNEDEAASAAALAKQDDEFRASLGLLKEAMEQDIALANEVKLQEAAAMEKLGATLSEEVAEREKQELQIATDVISGLKAKGYKVWANVIDIPKPLPATAAGILDPLKVGEWTKVIEWQGGYGVIRKMGENDTNVKFGYVYATKDDAMAPAAMDDQPVVADGTTPPADGTAPPTGTTEG